MEMKLYDKEKIDWKNLIFDNKALFMLLFPIIIEQLLNSFMGMADTMMVSTVGSEAISAVSLVDSLNNLVIQIFAAMAAGAAIICSQYLGSGNKQAANKASNMVLFPTSFSPTRIFMCLLNSTSRLLNFLKPSICNDFM